MLSRKLASSAFCGARSVVFSQEGSVLLHFHNRRPFLFKKQMNVSEASQPVQPTHVIPPANNISLGTLFKFDSNKLNLIRKYMDNKKLQSFQKTFYEETTDPKRAYYYLRELNRQRNFELVTDVYEKYKMQFNTIPANEIYHQKTLEQFHYAQNNLQKLNEDQVSLLSRREHEKEKIKFRYLLVRTAIYIFILTMVFSSPQIDKQVKKITEEDETKGGGGNGLFGNIFTKFVDNEGETNIKTRFSDVLGIDEFKDELIELTDYLKNPKKYTEAGAKIPKGILLVGPPGTGKTLLARALAGEAQCTFFYKAGSEFDELFVGMGARRVRELFKKARQKAPAIIFIDEIDSVAGTRRAADPSYTRDTINQILAEMDGFKQTDNVIIVGATNFPEAIDPAVRRPGRFDKIINVPLPDVKGREEVFNYYLKKIKIDNNVNASILARRTIGFSGADIQNMVNIAILNAVKNNRKDANADDFEYAMDRITMGIGRKKMFVSDRDKLVTAYHEGGHALTSLLTEGATPLHKVTILPRGGALGFTAMIPNKEQLSQSKKEILASIDVAMGGRAAEELLLGPEDYTTGWSSDLQKATELAYAFVRYYGFKENVALISARKDVTSEKYNYLVDQEVQKILQESLVRVKGLLKTNESNLKNLAKELVVAETMSVDEVKKVCKFH